MKIGQTLSGAAAPQVAGKPITISCDVETKAASGVIAAHGGSAIGYTVYLKDHHLVFAVHPSGGEIVRITSDTEFPRKASIEARLSADASMTLLIDGKVVASGKCGGLLKSQPKEEFCLGHDSGVTVDTYDGKTPFAGTITHLKVSTTTAK